jgi:hypothetical protein
LIPHLLCHDRAKQRGIRAALRWPDHQARLSLPCLWPGSGCLLTSATNCWAVGDYRMSSGGADLNQALRWNGHDPHQGSLRGQPSAGPQKLYRSAAPGPPMPRSAQTSARIRQSEPLTAASARCQPDSRTGRPGHPRYQPAHETPGQMRDEQVRRDSATMADVSRRCSSVGRAAVL